MSIFLQNFSMPTGSSRLVNYLRVRGTMYAWSHDNNVLLMIFHIFGTNIEFGEKLQKQISSKVRRFSGYLFKKIREILKQFAQVYDWQTPQFPKSPNSRSKPEFFTPQKGNLGAKYGDELIHTMPLSIRAAMAWVCAVSHPKMQAPRLYFVALANWIDSSSLSTI
jgi:hypothetical protein